MVFGIVAVVVGSHVDASVGAKIALVESGEIEPVDAVITKKAISKKTQTSSGGVNRPSTTTTTKEYGLVLKINESTSIGRTVNRTDYEAVQKGEVYDAYPIDGSFWPRAPCRFLQQWFCLRQDCLFLNIS